MRKCLTPNIVHEAKVFNKTNNKCKRYLSASETPFKERFRNQDFKHKKYEKCSELSKYIWTLKSHGIIPIDKWSIVKRVNKKKGSKLLQIMPNRNVLHHSIPR